MGINWKEATNAEEALAKLNQAKAELATMNLGAEDLDLEHRALQSDYEFRLRKLGIKVERKPQTLQSNEEYLLNSLPPPAPEAPSDDEYDAIRPRKTNAIASTPTNVSESNPVVAVPVSGDSTYGFNGEGFPPANPQSVVVPPIPELTLEQKRELVRKARQANYARGSAAYKAGFKPPVDILDPQYLREQTGLDSDNFLANLWGGIKSGFNYGIEPDTSGSPVSNAHRSRSALLQRAPLDEYDWMPPEAQAGFAVGRVGADIMGNGTRNWIFRGQLPDLTGTYIQADIKNSGGSRMATLLTPFAVNAALEVGSGLYNPTNLAQGGRPLGYAAINPDTEDPRQSTTPVSELVLDRGFFGKRGRLLPWEQFHQERPDISYENYSKYQDYTNNKDDNPLRSMTLGIVKGTGDGLDGPEVSWLGRTVTPTGALAAAATYVALKDGMGRTANIKV